MPVGHRVYSHIQRPPAELVAQFAEFNSTDLADAMNRSGTLNPSIRPAFPVSQRVVGPAVTVSVPTGSQRIRALGMDTAQAGDVVVFNGFGIVEYAVIGGNFGLSLLSRGVRGVVVDGAFRDLTEFQEMGLPVFAKGIATMSGPNEGPGEVNVPISCGNVVVRPGDIIVADNDGIVVIPPEYAEEVLTRVNAVVAASAAAQDSLRAGEILNVAEVRAQSLADGCEILASTNRNATT